MTFEAFKKTNIVSFPLNKKKKKKKKKKEN